jgi:broad specificity phosphatase PhoE
MRSSELILVKHALPEIVPDIPARSWRLGDEGRARSVRLATCLLKHRPDVVVTSDEPKAIETGEIIARTLGIRLRHAAGLHEHDRSTARYLGEDDFQQTMESFFRVPDTLLFGSETANQARDRFGRAIVQVLAAFPDETVAVVSHGTVMTLFVSDIEGIEPFPFWKRLGLPSFVVLDRTSLRLKLAVDTITGV